MPSVIVVGGGLAGLSAAAALADSGFDVDVLEARPFPGGRATSYETPGTGLIDNCQHILLRCCTNLLDFYRRLGVSGEVEFHRRFYFVEPGGRTSVLEPGGLPAPLHFTGAFSRLKFLSLAEKAALARACLALQIAWRRGRIPEGSMLSWLETQGQPERVIQRFWRQVLVSAVNEELDRMAAVHAFNVMMLGFFGPDGAFEMGVPQVALGELYSAERWRGLPGVRFRFRTKVTRIEPGRVEVEGAAHVADYVVVALPVGAVSDLLPGYAAPAVEHAPITGVHLWFDSSVTGLPHATLLDRSMQWMFNKGSGRQLQLVISASHSLTRLSRAEVVALAVKELAEFFPAVGEARLLRAHVVKEQKATFSATAAFERTRPGAETNLERVFVAGDWTRTGWPATMEGAVRSGYAAAEAVLRDAGRPRSFVLP